MLNKLDFYIIKKFLGAFLLSLGLFTIIILIFDFSEKIDEFIEKKVAISEIIFNHYFNFIPLLLNSFGPIFVFIAVIFFTSKMAGKSEVIAILSSGVSYLRFLRPFMVTAVLIALFSFFLNSYIIPKTEKERMEFELKYIRNIKNDYREHIRQQIQPGYIMSMRRFGHADSSGSGISLQRFVNSELVSKIDARRIAWNKEKKVWQLQDYVKRDFLPNGNEIIVKGRFLDTMIPFTPDQFFVRPEDIQMFDNKELKFYIDLEKQKGTGNNYIYETEQHRRIASPFSILILTFIGVCVSSIKQRGGIGVHLGKGLMISFVYLFVIQIFQSYGANGAMNPVWANWTPNIIFSGMAFWLYRTTQK